MGFIPDSDYLRSVVNKIGQFYDIDHNNIMFKITGNADGSFIRPGGIIYEGEYGDIRNETFTSNKQQRPLEISLSRGDRIISNEQLAFLRAYGVKKALMENLNITDSNSNIQLGIEVHQQLGDEYRNITIEIISKFKDD